MNTYLRSILLFLTSIVVFYVIVVIFFYLFQTNYIYLPPQQIIEECSDSRYEVINLDDTRALLHKNNDNIIVFYHGNAETACNSIFTHKYLSKSNHSILFVEYNGYGGSNRKPTKEAILDNVKDAVNFVQDYEQVIVFGQSIGAGPASYHAHIGNVDKLILVSPYTTFAQVGKYHYPFLPVSFLLTENYTPLSWLQDYNGDLLILAGEHDSVIPPHLSQELHESLQINTTYRAFARGHNDLWSSKEFTQTITDFMQS